MNNCNYHRVLWKPTDNNVCYTGHNKLLHTYRQQNYKTFVIVFIESAVFCFVFLMALSYVSLSDFTPDFIFILQVVVPSCSHGTGEEFVPHCTSNNDPLWYYIKLGLKLQSTSSLYHSPYTITSFHLFPSLFCACVLSSFPLSTCLPSCLPLALCDSVVG